LGLQKLLTMGQIGGELWKYFFLSFGFVLFYVRAFFVLFFEPTYFPAIIYPVLVRRIHIRTYLCTMDGETGGRRGSGHTVAQEPGQPAPHPHHPFKEERRRPTTGKKGGLR